MTTPADDPLPVSLCPGNPAGGSIGSRPVGNSALDVQHDPVRGPRLAERLARQRRPRRRVDDAAECVVAHSDQHRGLAPRRKHQSAVLLSYRARPEPH